MQHTVFYTLLDPPPEPELFAQLSARLSTAERGKIGRLPRESARCQRLFAYLLARMCASVSLGAANSSLCFLPGKNGKPHLCGHPGFHHSLSHADGAVAVSIASLPCGVDIERTTACNHRIAARFFTPGEAAYIRQADCDLRFFEVWCKKEACVKWSGKGLATPLSSFSVLDSPWRERLRGYEAGGFFLADCCEQSPQSPQQVGAGQLIHWAVAQPPADDSPTDL